MKLGYLGPRTNSEIAAQKVHSIDNLISFDSIEDIFEAMRLGKVERIIVPIYNSLTGEITKYKTLISQYRFITEKEVIIKVRHYVGSYNGDTSIIISHEEVLKQCKKYLDEHFPLAKRELTRSTEEAAKLAAERRKGVAIANLETCLYYGLKIMDEDVIKDNYSTFAVLKPVE